MRIRYQKFMPVAGYIALTVVLFLPVYAAGKGYLLYGDDIHHAYYFYREFFNAWIRQGVFPWWNPYLFGGEPFIANPLVNIWYPPNWLYIMLPLHWAYVLHVSFHIVWAMSGMHVLLLFALPRSRSMRRLSAWVGGVVFGLSGFFMARTYAGHVDIIAAASWMPWVMWGFCMLAQGKTVRSMVMAAFLFACQLYAGYHTMAAFTAFIVFAYIVGYAVRTRHFQVIVRAGAAGVLGIGLAALQLLPETEFVRASVRTYPFPYSWISYGSWEWKSLLQMVDPFLFGNQTTYQGPPPNFVEHSAFVGVLGLIFACIGSVSLLRAKKHHMLAGVLFLFCVMFGIWISLGPNAPIDLQYLLWKAVPLYRYLRIPPRHLILVVFGLSGLAGFGFHQLARIRFLRVAVWIVAISVTAEMVWFARGFIGVKPVPESRQNDGLIARLTQDAEPYRVLHNFGAWLPQRDALEFDGVMAHGIYSATGYNPMMLRAYYEYVANLTGADGKDAILSQDVQVPYLSFREGDALDFLNIKYIMVPPEYDPFSGSERYRLLEDNATYRYHLYENTTVKPRYFLKNGGCGSVRVISYTPNSVVLSADISCDTALLSSEVWYPGWEAYIDGKKVRTDKLIDTFRTLIVPLGKYTVVWQYNPIVYVYGGTISSVSWLIIFWLWFFGGKIGKSARLQIGTRIRKQES